VAFRPGTTGGPNSGPSSGRQICALSPKRVGGQRAQPGSEPSWTCAMMTRSGELPTSLPRNSQGQRSSRPARRTSSRMRASHDSRFPSTTSTHRILAARQPRTAQRQSARYGGRGGRLRGVDPPAPGAHRAGSGDPRTTGRSRRAVMSDHESVTPMPWLRRHSGHGHGDRCRAEEAAGSRPSCRRVRCSGFPPVTPLPRRERPRRRPRHRRRQQATARPAPAADPPRGPDRRREGRPARSTACRGRASR
jgi:hypothetical protein